MADEITATCVFAFSKSSSSFTASVNDLGIDVAGTNFIHNRQIVGTSEEALLLGDAGTGGYLFAINRDTTNWIGIRQGTGTTSLIKLSPGEPCLFRIHDDSTAPFIVGGAAALELEYWLIEK